ncbi:MAG: NAD(P)H-dependent oxidoreductase subunit E [Candidatus Omnitrophota bacterium]|nr:NAD(P)H-dependent oxidoreductase subunit E [Candidatus Omnitrophota bacterium]MBU1894943.1 NAD(P)H-dependent oxidoreductase subunit E [Candidatus Omnitrophota bacterium]
MQPICSVEKIIEKDGKKIVVCDDTRSQLFKLLQEAQDKNGYISDKDMQEIADILDIHPVEVYSVVTFYSFFTDKKKGQHIIRISNCMPNEMAGSKEIIKVFEDELKIKLGETTKDGLFTIEMTGCIGMCDQAPAIMVDDKLIGNVDTEKVKKIISGLKQK